MKHPPAVPDVHLLYPGRTLLLGFLVGPFAITTGFLAGAAEGALARAVIAGAIAAIGIAAAIGLWSSRGSTISWDWPAFVFRAVLAGLAEFLAFLPIAWLLGRMAQIG